MGQELIDIDESSFIGEGMGRKCYLHPSDKNLCIKIPSQKGIRSTNREIGYMNRLHKRGKSFEMIADFKSKIETTSGQGYIYELIRDFDGNISKNIDYYLSSRDRDVVDKITELIEDLRMYLIKEYILFSDLDIDNILVQQSEDGNLRLVVIDGIGDNNQIPFLEFVKPLGMGYCSEKWETFKSKIIFKFPNLENQIKPFIS